MKDPLSSCLLSVNRSSQDMIIGRLKQSQAKQTEGLFGSIWFVQVLSFNARGKKVCSRAEAHSSSFRITERSLDRSIHHETNAFLYSKMALCFWYRWAATYTVNAIPHSRKNADKLTKSMLFTRPSTGELLPVFTGRAKNPEGALSLGPFLLGEFTAYCTVQHCR